jgi:hypothetical protein
MTYAFRKRRLELKKKKTLFEMVYVAVKKIIDCITYKIDCAFLIELAVPIDEDDVKLNLEKDVGEIAIVLLDFETSSFEVNCDI